MISEKEEKEELLLRSGFGRGLMGSTWKGIFSTVLEVSEEEVAASSLEELHALIKARKRTAYERVLKMLGNENVR